MKNFGDRKFWLGVMISLFFLLCLSVATADAQDIDQLQPPPPAELVNYLNDTQDSEEESWEEAETTEISLDPRIQIETQVVWQ